jgi:acetyl-CoA carboxylase biotin carboxyl carrier protein
MSDLPLSPDDIAEIVAILDGGDYDRLDIRTARFALRIAREGGGWTQEWAQAGAGEASPVAVAPATVQVEAGGAAGVAVVPPLPGTFYRAPQPGAPPFVEVGARVAADTVVGIVETMKLMNPVYAGVAGTVAAILVENAALVTADAVLMRVAPAA